VEFHEVAQAGRRLARELLHGVEAFVNMSQMTVSQMSITETTDSPQHKLHWLSEQALAWSGLPVVTVRPTVFLEGFFQLMAAPGIRSSGTLALPMGPVVARHRRDVDGGFQVGRRDRHAEVEALHAFDGAMHGGKVRQVALDKLGAHLPQRLCTLVLPPDQGATFVPPSQQQFGEGTADAAHGARGAGYEDWGFIGVFCHVDVLG
jgi:uncharacterized protein YbjT (DUF2867 family)